MALKSELEYAGLRIQHAYRYDFASSDKAARKGEHRGACYVFGIDFSDLNFRSDVKNEQSCDCSFFCVQLFLDLNSLGEQPSDFRNTSAK